MTKYMIFGLVCYASLNVQAQVNPNTNAELGEVEIRFDYDDAGNRIRRYTVRVEPPTSGKNSLDTNQLAELVQSIRVYPNPTSDELFVKIDQEIAKELPNAIQMIDVSGKVVFRTEDVENMNQFDITKLTAGIYMLQIYRNELFETWRIVKQ